MPPRPDASTSAQLADALERIRRLENLLSAGVFTGGTFRTALPPNERIELGGGEEPQCITFYSGDLDETIPGRLCVQLNGVAGARVWQGIFTSGSLSGEDQAQIVVQSESQDGSSGNPVILLSANTVLVTNPAAGIEGTVQIQGDTAWLTSPVDPLVAGANVVRMWKPAGDGLRAISTSDTWPAGPVRIFENTGSDTGVTTIFPSYETMSTDCFVTFTTRVPNAVVILDGYLRFANTTGGWGGGVAVIADGTTTISAAASVQSELAGDTTIPVGEAVVVATPGTKTYRIRVSKIINAGTVFVAEAYLRALVIG